MASQSELLRRFYRVTGWQNENSYGSLTIPSRSLLDFSINPGLHLNLTHRPTLNFASSLSLSTLVPSHSFDFYPPSTTPVLSAPVSPTLAGQLAYVFSSAALDRATTKFTASDPIDRVKLKQITGAFHPGQLPVRPELREEAQPTWLAGERVDKQGPSDYCTSFTSLNSQRVLLSADFLLFGQLYAPSPRLDALWVQRLSPTLQTLVTLISVPSPLPTTPLTWQPNHDDAPTSPPAPSGALARQSELELKLLQDSGRWSTEYSYAVGDSMWGARALYNFGKSGSGVQSSNLESGNAVELGAGAGVACQDEDGAERRERVVDEEEEMSTGLKGRWSAGGEVYFSAQERSAGFSSGVRFSTLPEPAGSTPSQPPTTLTATVNPIMGQLSTAYAVATSPDSALSSRFDFNFFSYDADLTIGGEWYQRRHAGAKMVPEQGDEPITSQPKTYSPSWDPFGRKPALPSSLPVEDPSSPPAATPGSFISHSGFSSSDTTEEGEVTGVIKARLSTNTVGFLFLFPPAVSC